MQPPRRQSESDVQVTKSSAKGARMPDYKITIFRDGDIGIYVESDWAAIRGWEESANGMM
jgi:hypothetical protein